MAIRGTDSLLWSCAPDAPALSRCHLAVHKPTRVDWLCWNGIGVVVAAAAAPPTNYVCLSCQYKYAKIGISKQ